MHQDNILVCASVCLSPSFHLRAEQTRKANATARRTIQPVRVFVSGTLIEASTLICLFFQKTPGKKREKKTVQDMLGESRIDVDDPDSIWRRKHNAGPLTFGKIDPMGDYRSELAFHPDTLKKKGKRSFVFPFSF